MRDLRHIFEFIVSIKSPFEVPIMQAPTPMTIKNIAAEFNLDSSRLCGMCFDEVPPEQVLGEGQHFKCKLCPIIRKLGNGYANLTNHLQDKHLGDLQAHLKVQVGVKRGPMNAHVRNLSKDAKDYHDWIEWVIMCDLPLSFVENKYTRANSRMDQMGKTIFSEYMDAVCFTECILLSFIRVTLILFRCARR